MTFTIEDTGSFVLGTDSILREILLARGKLKSS